MRLSIAVGILSARSTLYSAQAAIDSTSVKKKDGRALLNLSGPRKSFGKKKTSLTGTQSATRSSSRVLEDDKVVECDWSASFPEDSTPDVGVLGCGSGEICMENADSSLGGVCSEYTGFRIDLVCDPTSAYYDTGCDCSAFDVETRTGSISCLDSLTYIGCNGVSSRNSTATILLEDSMYISRALCHEWVIGVNATTSSKSCVEWDDLTDGEPYSLNGTTTSCEVEIDGQACTLCTYTLAFTALSLSPNPWGTGLVDPFKADCSNVVDGLMIAPIGRLKWTDFPINQACDGSFCDLDYCPGGTSFDVYDKTPISLNGSYFTCGGISKSRLLVQTSSDKCPEATALAQAGCCKATMSSSPSTSLSFVLAGILLTGASIMSVLN